MTDRGLPAVPAHSVTERLLDAVEMLTTRQQTDSERLVRMEEQLKAIFELKTAQAAATAHAASESQAWRAAVALERDRVTTLRTQMTLVYAVGGSVGGALVVGLVAVAFRVFGHG